MNKYAMNIECTSYASKCKPFVKRVFHHQTIKTLSEQQYLDCAGSENKDGCNGGLPARCFKWTMENNNMLAYAKDYPYVAKGLKD